MAQGMNKVILLGNLGATPEMRMTESGSAVLKLRLATNESWVDRDGNRQERTDWHWATVFGKRAEALARHLRKGQALLIEGRLRTSSYEKEGTKHYSTEVVVDELCFTANRPAAGQESRRDDTASAPLTLATAPGLASGGRLLDLDGRGRAALGASAPSRGAGALSAEG